MSRPQAAANFTPSMLAVKVKPNKMEDQPNHLYLNAKNGLYLTNMVVDGIFTRDDKSLAFTEATTTNVLFSPINGTEDNVLKSFKLIDDFTKDFVQQEKDQIFKDGDGLENYTFKPTMAEYNEGAMVHQQVAMSIRLQPIGIYPETSVFHYENATSNKPTKKPNGIRELRRADKVMITFRPTLIYFTADKYGVSYSVDRALLMNEDDHNPEANSDDAFCDFAGEEIANPKKQRVQ